MTTFLKTAATALVLALATATVADASTLAHRTAPAHSVAGKGVTQKAVTGERTASRVGTPKIASHRIKAGTHLATRHHAHMARRLAKHGTVAHRVLGTKVARTAGLRHVAANHRASATTGVIR